MFRFPRLGCLLVRHSSSSSRSPPGSIGILREVKNKWERRTPLIPEDVAYLSERGIRVLVQPSSNRIYKDSEFRAAGAILTEDLSSANTILGVKEFPKESLLPNKSYMIFSHTIKAQAYNMPFLDECLNRRVRLFDYETVRQVGGGRLIAFGKFAGLAGFIDALRGLGERMLSLGYSTPFMGISSAYMYPDLEAAKSAIKAAAEQIRTLGLPEELQPFTFVFTGQGNVSQGAVEMFELLPHEWVKPEDLPNLKPNPFKVYGTIVTAEHMVQHSANPAQTFSSKHYYENPHEYSPVFHQRIAPYTSVLVNCMYWDPKFPRLLSIPQLQELEAKFPDQRKRRLLVDADITCDIGGSVECLKRSSTIDQPFYMYDPATDSLNDKIEGSGMLMLGVDNLPAEFPREASKHFSSKLRPFVEALARIDPAVPFSSLSSSLPPEVYNSCIAADGKLTPPYEYIAKLRAANEAAKAAAASHAPAARPKSNEVQATIMLTGHLFDTGFVNQALDLFEVHGSDFRVVHWDISPNRTNRAINMSRAVIEVSASSERQLEELLTAVQTLAKVMPLAKAQVTRLASHEYHASAPAAEASATPSSAAKPPAHRVLVLGSGYVSGPLVEYFARTSTARVTVASNDLQEAQRVVKDLPFCEAVKLDAVADQSELSRLISECHAVVSLLPASMHVPIAELCIQHRKHLVTASYVSPGMKALGDAAQRAGITILNEMGLDPGIDHMSALHAIESIKRAGGEIHHFESLCGGLPAPEAANNPFGYKFSWSPVGVLNATLNGAVYRKDGELRSVKPGELMRSAFAFDFNPAFAFQQYPNRDSLSYAPFYGLESSATMYRGTIRYSHTCSLLDSITRIGLISKEPVKLNQEPSSANWRGFMTQILGLSGSPTNEQFSTAIRGRLQSEGTQPAEIDRFLDALHWLGVFSLAEPVFRRGLQPSAQVAPMDVLCKLLEDKLCYSPGERDLVVMIHRFGVYWPRTGQRETRVASLIAYGGDGPAIPNASGAKGTAAWSVSGGGKGGYSAMARTVGLPAAIGTRLLLAGKIPSVGVIIPTSREIYEPVLEELKAEGIHFDESSSLNRE